MMQAIGYAEGSLSVYGSAFDGFGDLFVLAGPPDGFATTHYTKFATPVRFDLIPDDELLFSASTFVASDAFPGTLIGYIVEPVAALPNGDYVFEASGGQGTGPSPLWIATPTHGQAATAAFTLTIESP